MTLCIRRATEHDVTALLALFAQARATIAALGIDQWQNGYPSLDVVREDVARERCYAVLLGEQLCGAFVLVEDGEPTYDRICEGEWITGNESRDYVAIHRVAVAVEQRGRGVSSAIVDYAASRATELGRASLRIDTHRGNVVMRRMLEKHGFCHCGVIYLQDGAERVAYEKDLRNETE